MFIIKNPTKVLNHGTNAQSKAWKARLEEAIKAIEAGMAHLRQRRSRENSPEAGQRGQVLKRNRHHPARPVWRARCPLFRHAHYKDDGKARNPRGPLQSSEKVCERAQAHGAEQEGLERQAWAYASREQDPQAWQVLHKNWEAAKRLAIQH